MEDKNYELYDKIVGTIIQNILAESNRANGKIILWDYEPYNGLDRLYYNVACIVADIYNKQIYIETKLLTYLKLKIKNRKRKNLHWVWRKHNSLPEECKTSIYIIMEHIRNYYDISINVFDDINKEYYENINN